MIHIVIYLHLIYFSDLSNQKMNKIMIDLYKFNANLGHTDDNKSYHWSPFQIHKYKY